MRTLPFVKMQAQGNDFVIMDHRQGEHPNFSEEEVGLLCDRRLGIGCDQLLILNVDALADCRLQIFNSDASEAQNCGNGLRCVGALLLAQSQKASCEVALSDRSIHIEQGEHGIRVYMGKAVIVDQTSAYVDIDMGNPHRVYFETPQSFPKDRNIEIISGEIFGEAAGEHIYIDIIERGVGPTLACGSGACAVAAAVWLNENHHNPLMIHMQGGVVTVSGTSDALVLEGDVTSVFVGDIQI
ncbi:MAG: diaminopimelate epimerase [Mariprofundaceae bacterium]|nr:diaminopimelate epimerase [Mariprofundaceae bacterium]